MPLLKSNALTRALEKLWEHKIGEGFNTQHLNTPKHHPKPLPKIELPSAKRRPHFFRKIWFLGKRSQRHKRRWSKTGFQLLFWGPKVFKTQSLQTEKWSKKRTFRMILVESWLILIDWEILFATSFWRGNRRKPFASCSGWSMTVGLPTWRSRDQESS